MNIRHLIIRNISKYKSFYRLIAIAVVVAVAVITGSLVVGDSVRNTLVKRVDERLGNTETIIFSKYSYLNDEILDSLRHCGLDPQSPAKNERLRVKPAMTAKGVLLLNGFVSVSGKLTPVMVWGTDDLNIKKGEAKINNALFNEIKPAENIVLRLPSAGMVPLGSMFVTDTYTTSLRLELDTIVSVEQGGNLNLKNEQTIPLNIFVNREELAETMGISGKINVILSDKIISKKDFASAWNYKLSGLNVAPLRGKEQQSPPEGGATITSDRIFIQNKVVEMLCDSTSNRIYTYLANSININEGIVRITFNYTSFSDGTTGLSYNDYHRDNISIPYSFITAVDYYKGKKLNPDEILLSDYAASRLGAWNVLLEDTISVNYFISKQFKTLVEDSVFLKVGKVVPIKDLQADKTLSAEFPGLSNVERCTDWNSDLPINMNLITDEDEDFWKKYKNTPKAIVPYSTLAPRWKNAFGSATALQISDTNKLNDLTFEMFDIQLIYPRQAGITAAKSGVDFSSLFLSLGFFIIISAAMLMLVPLSEMLFRRRNELDLLKATGFSNKRIVRLLLRESTPIVFISAIVGVIVGLLYTYLVLFLLGNVWKGATHTDGFRVFPDIMTIAIGMSVGVVFSLSLLYINIRQKAKGKRLKVKGQRSKMRLSPFTFHLLPLTFLRYNRKQALLSFITLACGVLIVFSVGLNRRSFADSSQIRTATGGFALWAETAVPVYHNINTEEGRAKLALTDLPAETQIVQLLKYSADDASCLNLNKVVTPNVLGIDMIELENSDFEISKLLPKCCGRLGCELGNFYYNFKHTENSVIPALVDETVLQWSLGKKLSDTLVYLGEEGDTIRIQLAATLSNSIFQGSILIDKKLFSEIWSEVSGSEIMLVKVPNDKIAETKTLLSQALNNYGVRVTTTNERMKLFYSVTDTYLTIFLTLGGLGLLLGIFSFVIVVRKNLLARTTEITLYRSLGFNEKRIFCMLYKENIIIPISAILTGALFSLLGVSMGFGNVSAGIWVLAALFLLIFILCVVLFVKISVKKYLEQK